MINMERKKFNIYLDQDDYRALKFIYAESGQKMTESIRIAIKEYLIKGEYEKHKKKNS